MNHIRVEIDNAKELACAALALVGAPKQHAERVVDELIENDLAGYPSHGLMRTLSYIEEIRSGALNPTVSPKLDKPPEAGASHVVRVKAQRCFGALAGDLLVDELARSCALHPISLGFVDNAHHLGRLAHVGRRATVEHGLILIGYCNYLGHGHRVAAPGGSRARLCTNPLLMAIPTKTEPVLVDMSTTVVSEGFVRNAYLTQQPVPDGVLMDAEGKTVTDAALLYTDPPQATMSPMSGHKGYALALAVELLVGALGGCGNVSSAQQPGNGGVFIAVNPELSGTNMSQFTDTVEAILHFCSDDPNPDAHIRYPGQGYDRKVSINRKRGYLEYPEAAWRELNKPVINAGLDQ